MAEVTPWLISWPETSMAVSGWVLPEPSPYVMQKQESSQNALT